MKGRQTYFESSNEKMGNLESENFNYFIVRYVSVSLYFLGLVK